MTPPTSIPLDEYTGSRYRFSGDFGADPIIVSTNMHSGWHLAIDGQSVDGLWQGPFGMLALVPESGTHQYEITFDDGYWGPTVTAMGLGLVALIVLGDRARRIPHEVN